MNNKTYQICTRCVMDTSVSDITFDEKGICNYCSDFLENSGSVLEIDPVEQSQKLEALVAAVKKSGKGKKYDCIVGVSGGVDSSWALVQAVKHGLRPLAVHMDNTMMTNMVRILVIMNMRSMMMTTPVITRTKARVRRSMENKPSSSL
jgi:hypothetical protein